MVCWGSSPSSDILQSCCQEFAALRERSLSQQQGDSQDPLSHLSSPPSPRGRRRARGCNITPRYHQQVHHTRVSSLLSCSVHVLCYTKSTGSCIKPKGNSTKYHNPEALCCLAPIQKGSQLHSFNLLSLFSVIALKYIDPKFYLIFNCFCKVYPTKARQQASVKYDNFWEHWGNLRYFSSFFGCKNFSQMFRNRKEKEILPRYVSACLKNCMKNNEMA